MPSTPQLPLFDTQEGVLVLADDERGRIAYTPGLVAPSQAGSWFTGLRESVKWAAC